MKRYISYSEFNDMLSAFENDPAATINSMFSTFITMFNGTEDNVYWNQVVGHEDDTPTPKITKYIDNASDVFEGSILKYSTRYIRFPWKGGEPVRFCTVDSQGNIHWSTQIATDSDAYHDILAKFNDIIARWTRLNKERVIRTLSAFDLMYSPIENYNRVEDTYNGKSGIRTVGRTYDNQADPHSIEVDAPLNTVTMGTDGLSLSSVKVDVKVSPETLGAAASSSDNVFGNKLSTVSVSAGDFTPSASGTTGTEVKTSNYVTTFDSDTDHANTSSTQKGTTNQNSISQARSKTDVYGHAIIRKEKVDPNYTDSESFVNFGDNITGNIRGNIGVTTTQQMIEQEYDLRKKKLVDEFISELFEEIFLQVG